MIPGVDVGISFAQPGQLFPYGSTLSESQLQIADDCKVRKQAEIRLLNTQALVEYELFKARLISGITEANKFFDSDDQIIVQEYKFCTSLSFHKRLFIMEFRQIVSRTDQCNHTLELIFKESLQTGTDGHFNLILARENSHFVWRQFNSGAISPFGTSKSLVSLVLRWLQNDSTICLPASPALIS